MMKSSEAQARVVPAEPSAGSDIVMPLGLILEGGLSLLGYSYEEFEIERLWRLAPAGIAVSFLTMAPGCLAGGRACATSWSGT
jgi:hypothetical protein